MMNKLPGPRLAFLAEADPQALAECMVAMANSDGGLIIFGVSEDGRLVEPVWEEEAEGALREAAALCQPPVPSSWQEVDTKSGTLIGVQVERSLELHTLSDGRVLVRSGPGNRALSGEEIAELANSRQTAEFEIEVVPGARPEDLDPEVVAEYLENREVRGGGRVGTTAELLFEIGATDRQGNPTVTGILLFGNNPQMFFPQSGIVFVKFPGEEARGDDGGIGYGRRDELIGPLARLVARSWNVVFEEMRVGATVNGLEREELTEYPRFAVREALVNAVAHRDYRIKGRRIEIRMYGDRLEILSPGGLPGYMTLDNLVDEHFSRNPRLVSGLYQWGFIEELGLGIDRMIEEMVDAGHAPPKFEATPHSFKVVLSKKRERPAVPKWTRNMNERQMQALAFVREHGSITNSDYRGLCPQVSAETLRLDLVDLVEKGLLLKIGSKKGTHYILK